MKKYAVTICLAAFATAAGIAQVEKGKFLLGATTPLAGGTEYSALSPRSGAGFGVATVKSGTGQDEEKYKISTLDFSPYVGYAVVDNLVLGLGTSFVRQTIKPGDSDSGDKLTITVFSAGPHLRYYFLSSKVRPFLTAHGSFGSLKVKHVEDGDEDEAKVATSTFGGGAGVALFLNDAVSVDFQLGCQTLSAKDKEEDEDVEGTQNAFGLSVGFSWFLK